MQSGRRKGFTGKMAAASAMTMLFWGFSFVGADILMDTYAPIQTLSLRWLVAGFVFLVLIATGRLRLGLSGKAKKWLFINAAIQPCIYALFEIYGLQLTTATITSIFTATNSSMALLLGVLFFGRRASAKGILGVVAAFAGIVICTVFAPGFTAGGKLFGYLLLFLMVVCGGLYMQTSAKAGEDLPPLSVTAVMSFFAAPWFMLLNFVCGYGVETYTSVFSDWRLVACTLFLGLCCSVLAYVGFNYVLGTASDPAVAGNVVTSMITVIGVVAGVLFRGDPAGWHTVVGLALTITGVVISSKEA